MHRVILQSFSSKSDVIEIQPQTIAEQQTSNLSELIKEAYSIGETDGVVDALISNDILTKLSADMDTEDVAIQLVNAAIEASENNRGKLAAIINSILGSCCGSDNDISSHPKLALDVLGVVDEMNSNDDSVMITPDIVSLALVYYAITTSEEYESQYCILERAQRNAKKMGGSKLRKALAAERRKGGGSKTNNGKDTEQQLQTLIGNDIHILNETDDFIVIGKPSGTVCYHNKKTSAGKITNSRKKKKSRDNKETKRIDISLVDSLIDSAVSLSTLNPIARGIVHRIDRGTSGSIILAKTDEMHLKLVAFFFLRKVKKKYIALVPACSRNEDSNTLTLGSTGVIDIPVDGRPAHSTYKVIKQYGESSSDAQSALLLEVSTTTGRKHQVRVHCAEGLDRPIFLDPLYYSTADGNKSKPIDKKKRNDAYKVNIAEDNTVLPKAISDLLSENTNMKEQFFLHATSLSIDELDLSIEAPLPQWWTDTVKQLD